MRQSTRRKRQRAALRRINAEIKALLTQGVPCQRALQAARDRRYALETHTGLWIQSNGVYRNTDAGL